MAEVVEEKRLAKLTFPGMLERYKGEVMRALPRHLDADRMLRIALTCFRQNPKLAECDPRSVFAAVIIASQLGLEPGVLGQAYLIPYKNECQLIPGYQGLLDLVRRSGFVQRVEAHVVRHGDKFKYMTGLTTVLEHEPLLEGKPGPLRFAYAVAEFKAGGYHVEVMTEDQINTIRDRSQGYIASKKYNKPSPWETDTEEMWRKTVLRRICKFLPKSPELSTALALEDAAAHGPQALTVDSAADLSWQAPVLEVTTQEDRVAAKSEETLEQLKEKYAPISETDPAYAEKLRKEADRQKKAFAEKYGASQPEPSAGDGTATAAAADNAAAPSETQETHDAEPGSPAAGAEGATAPSASEPPAPLFAEEDDEDRPLSEAEVRELGEHGMPLSFDEPKSKNRKR